MTTPLVKVCGLTSRHDAELALAAGADLLGFVFVPGTPRCLAPDAAAWIAELRGAETVGVFRDAPLTEVLAIRRRLRLDRVQLHGAESDEDLAHLGPTTLRRVDPRHGEPWQRVATLAGRCLPLLDPGGGSGLAADWAELAASRPAGAVFALAGGLTAGTVRVAVNLLAPVLVDVSSGVEAAVGVKDPARLAAFVAAARAGATATGV